MRISPSRIGLLVLVAAIAACGGPPQSGPSPAPAEQLAHTQDQPPSKLEEIASFNAAPTTETKIIADLIGEKGEGEPVKGDWLVTRSPVEPSTLNVLLDTADAYAQRICINNVFESLVDTDNRTLQAIPLVADRWEISDDHLTYTFYLRKDVKF
ncbi:MAG: hypothetical protein SGI88_20395, partial [Candidatus Hydrogenedentes bacterium]|nr:hypothetical protein [Candidatus Hydrogenedentota bacterium]